MVLAAFDREVEESDIEAVAKMEVKGTPIDELERLARYFGLTANIETTTPDDLRRILKEGKLPIAYVDRAVFPLSPRQRERHTLRDVIIHAVIPARLTYARVILHDPMYRTITRRSLDIFQDAHRRLSSQAVVCSKE